MLLWFPGSKGTAGESNIVDCLAEESIINYPGVNLLILLIETNRCCFFCWHTRQRDKVFDSSSSLIYYFHTHSLLICKKGQYALVFHILMNNAGSQ